MIVGCGARRDIVGFWQTDDSQIVYEFTSGGAMRVSQGPMTVDLGTYRLKGDILELRQNPATAISPKSDLLPLQIRWQDGDHFTLPNLAAEPTAVGLTFHRITAGDRDRLARLAPDIQTPPEVPFGNMPAPPKGLVEATTCTANMKQIAMAAQMYSQDYDGALPGANPWSEQLRPYLRNDNLLTCPAVSVGGAVGGYSLNSDLAGARMSAVQAPESVPLIFESQVLTLDSIEPFSSFLQVSRHGETRSVAYADGHARGLKAGE